MAEDNFTTWRRDLLAAARNQGTSADRTVARVHAEAAVSQAESLARIADLVERMTLDVAVESDEVATEQLPDYRRYVVGDVVDLYESAAEWHVDGVSEDQGDQRLSLINHEGKSILTWGSRVEFIRHDSAATDDEPEGEDLEVIAASKKFWVDRDASGADDVDADFEQAGAVDEAAEADKADAFAAARKATGKAKKGGK